MQIIARSHGRQSGRDILQVRLDLVQKPSTFPNRGSEVVAALWRRGAPAVRCWRDAVVRLPLTTVVLRDTSPVRQLNAPTLFAGLSDE